MAKKNKQDEDRNLPREVRDALAVAAEINETIEDEISDRAKMRGAEFFEGVQERTDDIAETLRETGHVTDKQRGALDNMLAAVKKWVHPRRDDDD